MKSLLLNALHMILKPDLKIISSLCKCWLYLPSQASTKDQGYAWIFKQISLPLYKQRTQ